MDPPGVNALLGVRACLHSSLSLYVVAGLSLSFTYAMFSHVRIEQLGLHTYSTCTSFVLTRRCSACRVTGAPSRLKPYRGYVRAERRHATDRLEKPSIRNT